MRSQTPEAARAAVAGRTRSMLAEAACGSPAARRPLLDQVVVLNLPVAGAVAARYHGRGQPLDDLVQAATVGLVTAAQRFDPSRGHDFLSYAVPLMTGEVRRHFRDHTFLVRPTRRVQELRQRVHGARRVLVQQNGSLPSVHDLATALEVRAEEVVEALAADSCAHPLSLDLRTDGAGGTVGERVGHDDPRIEEVDNRLVVGAALAELDERDQRIVRLRFYREWSQERIAGDVGLSQMQVSRRLRRILDVLRVAIG